MREKDRRLRRRRQRRMKRFRQRRLEEAASRQTAARLSGVRRIRSGASRKKAEAPAEAAPTRTGNAPEDQHDG